MSMFHGKGLARFIPAKLIVNLAITCSLLTTPVTALAQDAVNAAAVPLLCQAGERQVVLQAGTQDNFATTADQNPATPSQALQQFIAQFPGAGQQPLVNFDATTSDRFFGHTFNFADYTASITQAMLETTVKPMATDSDNDSLSLRFAGGSTVAWGSYLGAVSSASGLLPHAWNPTNYPNGNSFTFTLGGLPNPGSTASTNLISEMNTHGFLDFVTQDDTSVDYLRLTLCVQVADVGDAPDSTNHPGAVMSAYPNVPANFPTVFWGDPVPGPAHRQPKTDAWLGRDISAEKDADLVYDADGLTNIEPLNNAANRDGYDDGVRLNTLALPTCGMTKFQYDVRIVGPLTTRYANVWFDFNKDGDWADVLQCLSNGRVVTVKEWAVVNQPISKGPGFHLVTTPEFAALTPCACDQSMWMRITLSEGKAATIPGTAQADGRGPSRGYRSGETEDYLIKYALPAVTKAESAAEEPGFTEIDPATVEYTDALETDGNVEELAETEQATPHQIYVPIVQK